MRIKGIKDGMVMQRGKDNFCEIYFTSDEPIKSIEVDSPYSTPKVKKDGERYKLSGIVQGGPYTLKLNDTTFSNIYVGDVWLLIGQSNMQGIGRRTNTEYNNNDKIRAFYLDSVWDKANHPLHELGKATHKVHTDVLGAQNTAYNITGVGPGLDFAKRMFELTAVPQGIICCAHGGTNLFEQWSPKKLKLGGDKSLYAAAFDRFISNGSNCSGAFWYQGESDAKAEIYKKYSENMIEFVKAMRKDFKADLPFIQVQIGRCSWSERNNKEANISWTSIREQQRKLNNLIENFDTVNTVSYRLSECIHIDATAQKKVGKDAAEAMFCLKFGQLQNCVPGIKLKSMKIVDDSFNPNMCEIILSYDNLHGALNSSGRAMGFEIGGENDYPDDGGIFDAYVDGNRVMLHCDNSKKTILGKKLWYGYGRDNSCNIEDGYGRSLPCFGPIIIKDGTVE